jgi:hypothetical protein
MGQFPAHWDRRLVSTDHRLGARRVDQTAVARPFAASRIATVARELLEASTLCAIATVTPRAEAHVNTAYVAWSPEFDIVWLSDPGARH